MSTGLNWQGILADGASYNLEVLPPVILNSGFITDPAFGNSQISSLKGRFFVNVKNSNNSHTDLPRLLKMSQTAFYRVEFENEVLQDKPWIPMDTGFSDAVISSWPGDSVINDPKYWFAQPAIVFDQNENQNIEYKIVTTFYFTDTTFDVNDYESRIDNTNGLSYPHYPKSGKTYDEYNVSETAVHEFTVTLEKNLPVLNLYTIEPVLGEKPLTVTFTPDSSSFISFPNASSYNLVNWFYRKNGGEWTWFSSSNSLFTYTFNSGGVYDIKIEANNSQDSTPRISEIYSEQITITESRAVGKIALSVVYSPFSKNGATGNSPYYDDYEDVHTLFDETKFVAGNNLPIIGESKLDKFFFASIIDSDTEYNNQVVSVARSDKPTLFFDFDQTKAAYEKYNYPILYIPENKYSSNRVIIAGGNKNKKINLQNNKEYFCPRNISILDVEDFGPMINLETGEEE